MWDVSWLASAEGLCSMLSKRINGDIRSFGILRSVQWQLLTGDLGQLSVPPSEVKYSWTAWPLKMGPIDRPETSVINYLSTLRNVPEERRSHSHRGRSLQSRINRNSTWKFKNKFWDEVFWNDNAGCPFYPSTTGTEKKLAVSLVESPPPTVGHGLLIHEVPRSHTTTHQIR